jgi:hypothetical protein
VRHSGPRFSLGVLVLLLILGLVVAGCQATPGYSGDGSAPATSIPAASTPAVTAGATSAASGIPAQEVSGSRTALEPGRYTRRGFVPRITFELDGPWHSVNALNGFFDVQQDVGSPDVIAVQFARPDQVYAAPDIPAAVDGAQAAVIALEHNARLTVVESSSSRIGGLTGVQVTVENPAGSTGDAQVLHVPPGALSISPGRRLWIALIDTPDGLLAIMVGGSVANWEEALAVAEPVLESVTIGQ